MLSAVACLLSLLAPSHAPPRVTPVPLEDPSGTALASFHAALRATAQRRTPVVVQQYGSSGTASG